MPNLYFDESYGYLSYVQRAAYRKFNVSPADHSYLIARFGEENRSSITEFVVNNSPNGMFTVPFFH